MPRATAGGDALTGEARLPDDTTPPAARPAADTPAPALTPAGPPAADTPMRAVDKPKSVPTLLATAPQREPGTRASRREAVSLREATTAAERALPSLRTCSDVPRRITADIDIVRGRGAVTKLNLLAPAPDNPPWHACAKRALESVRYPESATPSPVQVRLILR